jgi:hypothetical protein
MTDPVHAADHWSDSASFFIVANNEGDRFVALVLDSGVGLAMTAQEARTIAAHLVDGANRLDKQPGAYLANGLSMN